MNIHDVITEFKNLDPSTLQCTRNRKSNTIWFHGTGQLKVHVRTSTNDDEPETHKVSLYKLPKLSQPGGESYRITIEDDFISSSYIESVIEKVSIDIGIQDFNEYTEESFFQESLISDFGNISFEDLSTLISLRKTFIELYERSKYANS